MGAWNPWRALRARDHIDFFLAPLPFQLRAVLWPRGERSAIVIDPSLTRQERSAALAHELVHDERGGGCGCPEDAPPAWRPVAVREERAVSREVARRLLPVGPLMAFVAARVEAGDSVTPATVAEEFDTTEDVARVALVLLGR